MAIVKLDKRTTDQVQSHLPQVKTGNMVELNVLMNGDDLTQTFKKYTKRAALECRIEIEPIVNVRDALARCL